MSLRFNMTPLIDIVFLLIIFFVVICRFIEAENFNVVVPDDCEFAQRSKEDKTGRTTVTVMETEDGKVGFAVGAVPVDASDSAETVEKITELINLQLKAQPANSRVVTLRINKDTVFADAQYVLTAVSRSDATDIRLAVLKDSRP